MSCDKPVSGMRMFLYAILKLIRQGKTEDSMLIQDKLSQGVASYLYQKYRIEFESLCPDNLEELDMYYKQWNGVSDGKLEAYECTEKDGLYLLVKLVLNDIV